MTLVESKRKSIKPRKLPHVRQCIICDDTFYYSQEEPSRLYCSNQYCLEVYINAYILDRYPGYSHWDCNHKSVFAALKEICIILDNNIPNTPTVFRPFTHLFVCNKCGCRFIGRGEEDDNKCWFCTWVKYDGRSKKCKLFLRVKNDQLARAFRWDSAERLMHGTFYTSEEALKRRFRRQRIVYDYYRSGSLPWPVGRYHPKWLYIASEIRKRDGVCVNCKANPTNKTLQVHHIDGNKYNNTWGNLAALCKSCHSRAHTHWAEIDDLTKRLNTEANSINNVCLNHILKVHANDLEILKKVVYKG